MTSVSERMQSLRDRGECALVPFITAGDPDLDTTAKALHILDQNGADVIELGVPYSDPLADGPIIQAAATRALSQGVKLDDVLKLVQQISPTMQAPIVLFTYYNPILNRGIKTFLDDIATAGVKGLVVPDLPLEEVDTLMEPAIAAGIELTLLVAPTSPIERIKAITARSQGFVYLVSVTGVTGMRTQVNDRVQSLLQDLHQASDKCIGVGFGVSQPEQAAQLRSWGADAVIVGSAFVKRLAGENPAEGLAAVQSLCSELKAALRQ